MATATASTLPRREVPGPRGYPLVGVIPQAKKGSLSFFVRAAVDYGDVVRLDFGPKRYFLVSHPEGLRHILQENSRNYVKGYDVMKPLLGEGLVTSEGEHWLRQRRLIQPAFHKQHIASLAGVMVDRTQEMLDRWAETAARGESLDVATEAMMLTQTIIVQTMFGTSVEAQSRAVMEAFTTILEYQNHLLFKPIKLPAWLPTATHRRYRNALRLLDRTVYGFIDQRRRGGTRSGDLLDMLLAARDADSGAGMDDRQVRDEMMTIFLAGHETTATTLAWTWYALWRNPNVLARMEAEVDAALGGRAPTMEDITRLPYTRMVVDETIRLYPAAWMFARVTLGDDEICGYPVPRGARVMLSPYVLHRRPDLWENPDQFDPTRFTPERAAARPRFAYLPFGGGPRICIGNNFAMTEAVLILAMTAQRFRMSLVPGFEVKAQATSTLRPRPGVRMKLQPRAVSPR